MLKRSKRFYSPGLISLVGYLFLLPYAEERIAGKKEGMIVINVPIDQEDDTSYIRLFSSRNISNEINRKNNILFNLDNNERDNFEKFKLIRFEAKRLKYTNDTNSVIVIKLSDSSYYSAIVELVNICEVDRHKRFALFDRQFVIFGESLPIKSIVSPGTTACFLCNDLILISKKKTIFEKLSLLIKPFNLFQIGGLTLIWILMILTEIIYYKCQIKKSPL
jgi:hypothetical protein